MVGVISVWLAARAGAPRQRQAHLEHPARRNSGAGGVRGDCTSWAMRLINSSGVYTSAPEYLSDCGGSVWPRTTKARRMRLRTLACTVAMALSSSPVVA